MITLMFTMRLLLLLLIKMILLLLLVIIVVITIMLILLTIIIVRSPAPGERGDHGRLQEGRGAGQGGGLESYSLYITKLAMYSFRL